MAEIQQSPSLCIEISPDRMSARLVAKSSFLSKKWPTNELKALCTAAGLHMTPELEQTLAGLEDAAKRPANTESFEIARGVAPTHAVPTALLITHAGGVVSKGTVIGQMEPARAGSEGVDVTGSVIAHEPVPDSVPPLPALTRLEGDTLITETDSYLHTEGHTASVDPITIVDKLNPSDQAIVFDRTVLVKANVHKGIPIQARRSLVIEGSIDAATVTAVHDFVVEGVFGGALGRIVVGRNMRASFIRQANVVVNGNLHVMDELCESEIICFGKIVAPEAEVRGGRVHAEEGIEVRSIGDEAMVRTSVEVGVDASFEKLLTSRKSKILNGQKHIEQVRMHVAPLMANPKRLTNAQKEKATELLFEADELQGAIDSHLNELRSAMELMKKRSESTLVVHSGIYPGTTIRFQGVETTIRSKITGPCRIVAEGLETKPRIVLFAGTSSTPQVLESRAIATNAFKEMRKLAA